MPNCCASSCRTPTSISATPPIPAPTCPTALGLEGYDGVVITGSALHVYDRGPHIEPQIELARAVFDSSTPLFGSCWGLQVITTAAGGSVRRNPKGREIGFGRRIRLTASGRGHPIFAGKDEVFDAVTIHLDEVETLAPNMHVLALNAFSAVQAAEVTVQWLHRLGRAISSGIFAGRHRGELPPPRQAAGRGAILQRRGRRAAPMPTRSMRCIADPHDKPMAWKLGLDSTVLDKKFRTREIRNWITHQVLPTRSRARTGVTLGVCRSSCGCHRRHRRARHRRGLSAAGAGCHLSHSGS